MVKNGQALIHSRVNNSKGKGKLCVCVYVCTHVGACVGHTVQNDHLKLSSLDRMDEVGVDEVSKTWF